MKFFRKKHSLALQLVKMDMDPGQQPPNDDPYPAKLYRSNRILIRIYNIGTLRNLGSVPNLYTFCPDPDPSRELLLLRIKNN
jgi:hypothetical protein